jgi:hypothetical protein
MKTVARVEDDGFDDIVKSRLAEDGDVEDGSTAAREDFDTLELIPVVVSLRLASEALNTKTTLGRFGSSYIRETFNLLGLHYTTPDQGAIRPEILMQLSPLMHDDELLEKQIANAKARRLLQPT